MKEQQKGGGMADQRCNREPSENGGRRVDSPEERARQLQSSIELLLRGSAERYAHSEIIGRLIANVPRLPVYAHGLLGRINDPKSSSGDIAAMVREDPSLAAMILKTVNSAFYGFPATIRDLQHAIALLGMAQVTQIVIANAILSTMPQTAPFQELRVHSMAMSFLAGELAELAGAERAAAETLGLIHDIGRSVVLLLKDKHPALELFFELLNQDELGAMLFAHWNLPPELCGTIRHQSLPHYLPPESLPKENRTMLLLVGLAHEVIDHLTCGKGEGLFFKEHVRAVGLEASNRKVLAEEIILPRLRAKARSLPVVVRELLEI
jgi:HD-like signal output (HDOD) protein